MRTTPKTQSQKQAQQTLNNHLNNGHPYKLIAWRTGLRPTTLHTLHKTGHITPKHAEQLNNTPNDLHQWVPKHHITDVLVELRAAHIPPAWYRQQLGWPPHQDPQFDQYVPKQQAEQVYALYRLWVDGTLDGHVTIDGQHHRIRRFEGSRDSSHPYVLLAEILEERAHRDWRADAECVRRRIPTTRFFQDDFTPGSRETMMRTAAEVCAVCPVAAECLASLADLEIGVVGRLTVTQRRDLVGSDAVR